MKEIKIPHYIYDGIKAELNEWFGEGEKMVYIWHTPDTQGSVFEILLGEKYINELKRNGKVGSIISWFDDAKYHTISLKQKEIKKINTHNHTLDYSEITRAFVLGEYYKYIDSLFKRVEAQKYRCMNGNRFYDFETDTFTLFMCDYGFMQDSEGMLYMIEFIDGNLDEWRKVREYHSIYKEPYIEFKDIKLNDTAINLLSNCQYVNIKSVCIDGEKYGSEILLRNVIINGEVINYVYGGKNEENIFFDIYEQCKRYSYIDTTALYYKLKTLGVKYNGDHYIKLNNEGSLDVFKLGIDNGEMVKVGTINNKKG